MKTRTPKLSPAQIAYATAKALVETLRAECDAEFAKAGLVYTREMSEDAFDVVSNAREDIEERLGYWQAKTALHNAEQAMIAWAQSVVKQNHPRDYDRVAKAFDAPLTLALHHKLVDLCFKLGA